MTALETLLAAKAESDRRNFAKKHALLRDMMARNPGQFVIDSDDGRGILGLTHVPTNFKIHVPSAVPPVPLAQAVKTAEDLLAAVVADRRTSAAESLLDLFRFDAAETLLKLATTPLPIPMPAMSPAAKAVQVANRAVARSVTTPKPVPAPVPKPVVAKPTAPAAVPKPAPAPAPAAPASAPAPVPPAGSTAGAVARAPVNYVKSIAGYGEGGSLQGQKLLDSTSVKPRMYRAEYKKRLAEGATPEDLAKTHQLPSWTERIPGMGTVAQVGHAMNRNRILHPFVQTTNTVSNLVSTPLTRPFSKPLEKKLFDYGRANVERGGLRGLLGRAQQAGGGALWAGDAAVGTVGRLASTGSMGLGAVQTARNIWDRPGQQAEAMLRTLPGATDESIAANPELQRLKRNPLPAIWDGLTDDSDLAHAQRNIGREMTPYTVRNSAAHTLDQMENDPLTKAVSYLRLPTLGGLITRPTLAAIADPTPPPVNNIAREELKRTMPKVLDNYEANVASPTGQRTLRLLEPVVKNPELPRLANNAAAAEARGTGRGVEWDATRPDRLSAIEQAQQAQEQLDVSALAADPTIGPVLRMPEVKPTRDAAVGEVLDRVLPETATITWTDRETGRRHYQVVPKGDVSKYDVQVVGGPQ